jgi:DedD protein
MEKKKLLLVAVSVGVFLVIVVGAAILVFSPTGQPGVISDWRSLPGGPDIPSRSATTDPTEILKSDELRGLQDASSSSPIQENRIYPNGEPSEIAAKTSEPRQEPKAVINVSRPQTAAVPSSSQEKPQAKPPVQTPAPVQAAKPKPASPVPSKPAASAAAPKKAARDFWIQAGSYSSRDGADSVKKDLSDKGITAIITNQQVDNIMRYRVRIGPYTTRNEADYWLSMVKSINGFENSQVWESQSRR